MKTATRNHGKAWTSDEVKVLTKKFKQGTAPSTIAVSLGRTTVAIVAKLKALGYVIYNKGILYKPYFNMFSGRAVGRERGY